MARAKKATEAKGFAAYVGTYTTDGEAGLYVYDVKKDGEFFKLREKINLSNLSYMITSRDYEILYCIVDEGVSAFKMLPNGDLSYMNTKSIGGMRGCHMCIDKGRRFVFVAGFHDGRVSMVKLKKDGSMSGVADGVFHRGHAISSTERRLDHPKVSSVCLTPEEKFVCATDYGLNQMRVYSIDYDKGKMELVETVRCAMDSAPRKVNFSKDGKFCYILTESANLIEVYEYKVENGKPVFDLIQRIKILDDTYVAAAATHMFISQDQEYVFVSIDGMNYVSWLKRDKETGLLEKSGVSPVSGDYPKYIKMLPGTNELIVLNHDSNEIRDYKVNFEGGYMLLCEKPATLSRSNCVCFKKIEE